MENMNKKRNNRKRINKEREINYMYGKRPMSVTMLDTKGKYYL